VYCWGCVLGACILPQAPSLALSLFPGCHDISSSFHHVLQRPRLPASPQDKAMSTANL
jgi:hypothetical protein